jgi:N-carbamoyl-L-amino-acid hydrolase
MGSHIDTVPDGGNYDGNVGSLSSIEVVKTLFESKSIVHHPLQVIIFENEEGGHIGSRAITAGLSKKDLELQSLS